MPKTKDRELPLFTSPMDGKARLYDYIRRYHRIDPAAFEMVYVGAQLLAKMPNASWDDIKETVDVERPREWSGLRYGA